MHDQSQTNAIEQGKQGDGQNGAENLECGTLREGWRNFKVKARSVLVPYPIAIACQHTKPISTGRKPCIECLPAPPSVLPILVEAVKLIFEKHPLRNQKTCGGVIDFDCAGVDGQTKIFGISGRLAIN